MEKKRGGRERLIVLFICLVAAGVISVVLISTGIVEFNPDKGFAVDPIEADRIELRIELHAANKNVVPEKSVAVTLPADVQKLLNLHNTAMIRTTRRSIDKERYTLYFYSGGNLTERWHIDKRGYTSYSTRFGTYTLQNNFDFELLDEFLS
jgi:hypothetical protein